MKRIKLAFEIAKIRLGYYWWLFNYARWRLWQYLTVAPPTTEEWALAPAKVMRHYNRGILTDRDVASYVRSEIVAFRNSN